METGNILDEVVNDYMKVTKYEITMNKQLYTDYEVLFNFYDRIIEQILHNTHDVDLKVTLFNIFKANFEEAKKMVAESNKSRNKIKNEVNNEIGYKIEHDTTNSIDGQDITSSYESGETSDYLDTGGSILDEIVDENIDIIKTKIIDIYQKNWKYYKMLNLYNFFADTIIKIEDVNLKIDIYNIFRKNFEKTEKIIMEKIKQEHKIGDNQIPRVFTYYNVNNESNEIQNVKKPTRLYRCSIFSPRIKVEELGRRSILNYQGAIDAIDAGNNNDLAR